MHYKWLVPTGYLQAKLSSFWGVSTFLSLSVSPYRTCSASTPPEEEDMEKRRKQPADLRTSAGAWMRLSLRGAVCLNTEWPKKECEEKIRRQEGEQTSHRWRGTHGEITESQAQCKMDKTERGCLIKMKRFFEVTQQQSYHHTVRELDLDVG